MNEYFKAGFEKIALRDIEMRRNSRGVFEASNNVPASPSGSPPQSRALVPAKPRNTLVVKPPKAPKPLKTPKFRGGRGIGLGLAAAGVGTLLGLNSDNY